MPKYHRYSKCYTKASQIKQGKVHLKHVQKTSPTKSHLNHLKETCQITSLKYAQRHANSHRTHISKTMPHSFQTCQKDLSSFIQTLKMTCRLQFNYHKDKARSIQNMSKRPILFSDTLKICVKAMSSPVEPTSGRPGTFHLNHVKIPTKSHQTDFN